MPTTLGTADTEPLAASPPRAAVEVGARLAPAKVIAVPILGRGRKVRPKGRKEYAEIIGDVPGAFASWALRARTGRREGGHQAKQPQGGGVTGGIRLAGTNALAFA